MAMTYKLRNMKTLEKIKNWFRRQFWWRIWYHKARITEREANSGRCLLCHASIKVNRGSSQPVCTNPSNPCPCKYNERLIVKK